jgi:hypothetical protein
VEGGLIEQINSASKGPSILFTVDKDGYWKSDISGRMYDQDMLGQFIISLIGACLAAE